MHARTSVCHKKQRWFQTWSSEIRSQQNLCLGVAPTIFLVIHNSETDWKLKVINPKSCVSTQSTVNASHADSKLSVMMLVSVKPSLNYWFIGGVEHSFIGGSICNSGTHFGDCNSCGANMQMSGPFLITGKGDYEQWPMTWNFNCHLLASFELETIVYCGFKDVSGIFVDFSHQNKTYRKMCCPTSLLVIYWWQIMTAGDLFLYISEFIRRCQPTWVLNYSHPDAWS